MPKSEAQRRYVLAASKGASRPEKVEEFAQGGACYACGGMVDADGHAFGGEVHEDEKRESYDEFENAIDEALAPKDDEGDGRKSDDEDDYNADFAKAVMRRRK